MSSPVNLPSQNYDQPQSRSTLIVGLYSLITVAAIIISAGRDDLDIYRLAGVSTPWKLGLSPVVGVVLGLVVVLFTRLGVHRFAWARGLHRNFRGILGGLNARDILILALASSIGEELLFRGALLPWIGIWWSTAIFALLHIGPGVRFLPWTISAFVIGLAFGQLYLSFGDLGAPIVAHFTINYLNLKYIVRVELPPEGE